MIMTVHRANPFERWIEHELAETANETLAAAPLERIVVTDTVPVPDEKRFDNLRVLSIAPLVAVAIDAVFEDGSVSELFGGDNV